jgi:tetratricopeptide (TPR) repeat protein
MISLCSTEGSTRLSDLLQEGKGYLSAQNFKKARSLYESVIRDCPDCVEARNNLGVALCGLNLYRKALDEFDRIGEDQRTEKTWYNISLTYYNSRNFDQALKCIQKAIEKDSNDPTALGLKGRIHADTVVRPPVIYRGASLNLCHRFSATASQPIRSLPPCGRTPHLH